MIANTVVLALDNIVVDEDGISFMKMLNLIFTIIFTVEMGLKILGLGLAGYFRDNMNKFDCLIVIISLIELSIL